MLVSAPVRDLAETTSDYPKQINQQGGMRHDGGRRESEPSSIGEDERMPESLSNAWPIHQKKRKNNRTDRGWWS